MRSFSIPAKLRMVAAIRVVCSLLLLDARSPNLTLENIMVLSTFRGL